MMKKKDNKIEYVVIITSAIIFSAISFIYLVVFPCRVTYLNIENIEVRDEGIYLSWNDTLSEKYRVYRKEGDGNWEIITYSEKACYFDKDVLHNKYYSYAIQCVDDNKNAVSKKKYVDTNILFISSPNINNYYIDSGITIEWSNVEGACGYDILREVDGEWRIIASVGEDVCSFTDYSAVSEGEYKYAIKNKGDEYIYQPNKKVTSIIKYDYPKKARLKYTAEGVRLTWNKVLGIDKYCILRKNDFEKEWEEVAITDNNQYIDNAVEVGKSYIYTIRCIDEYEVDYESYYNEEGWMITVCDEPELEEAYVDEENIILKWKQVENAEKYRIFVKIDDEKKYTRLATVDNNTFTYEYLTTEKNHKYTFTVRCISDDESMYTSIYNVSGISVEY